MNKFFKISKLLFLLFFIYSCGSFGEVLQGKKRSDQGDEFLINKKKPLVMPPDFENLPKPGETNVKSSNEIVSDQSNIKALLKEKKECVIENNCEENISSSDNSSSDNSSSIESSILKKIN